MAVHGSGTPTPNIAAPIVLAGDAPDGATQTNDVAYQLDQLASAQDTVQAGVVGPTDGNWASHASLNASTGALSGTGGPGGLAWVPTAAGLLVRGAIPTSFSAITPAGLPANGKFATIGIDLVAAARGAAHTIALSAKGTDQTTSDLALANPPATAAGRVRLRDYVILNTAGVYTSIAERDRRPWAGGAIATIGPTSAASPTATVFTVLGGSVRLEITTGLVIAQWSMKPNSASTTIQLQTGVNLDAAGSFLGGTQNTVTVTTSSTAPAAGLAVISGLSPGSHLFSIAGLTDTGTINLASFNAVFREIDPAANNGTS